MLIYKSKWFKKWADKEGLVDKSLKDSIDDVSHGLIDADLGGHVYKKRVAIEGQGKSGGLRTLLAFKLDDKAFFMYGFSKNKRSNISIKAVS